jgi:WD40 repeat protein
VSKFIEILLIQKNYHELVKIWCFEASEELEKLHADESIVELFEQEFNPPVFGKKSIRREILLGLYRIDAFVLKVCQDFEIDEILVVNKRLQTKCRSKVHSVLDLGSKLGIAFKGHSAAIRCVCIGNGFIATGSYDQHIRIWNKYTGECKMILEGHSNRVECICNVNEFIVSGSWDKTIRIWNHKNGSCVRVIEVGHTDCIYDLSAFKDKIFSASRDFTIRIWSLETGENLKILKGHKEGVRCLC